MVWRQLPKLIPAGSIPVSRSKREPRIFSEVFLFWSERLSNHRRKRGYKARHIFAAPVGSGSQSLAPLGANSRLHSFYHRRKRGYKIRYIFLLRLSVRARRALRPWRKLPPLFCRRRKRGIKHDISLPRLSVRTRRALRPWRKLPSLFCRRRKRGYKIRYIFLLRLSVRARRALRPWRKLPSLFCRRRKRKNSHYGRTFRLHLFLVLDYFPLSWYNMRKSYKEMIV